MFDEKGQIIIDKEECEMDSDELMMLALDAGAEDFVEEEDSYEVLTVPEDFSEVRLKAGRSRNPDGKCRSDNDPTDLGRTDR